MYRFHNKVVEFLLVHPGGPFWRNKDEGAWSIPKGEFEEDEQALDTAIREFKEELGLDAAGPFTALKPVKQLGGKRIYAWAMQADMDVRNIISNTFVTEWPPRSGIMETFPEVDKAGWFSAAIAKDKINPAQVSLLTELIKLKKSSFSASDVSGG